MEFTLRDTDIFDASLDKKIYQMVKDKLNFEENHQYELIIAFHVSSIRDIRQKDFFADYVESTLKFPKKKGEEIISDILSYQLEQVENVLSEYSVEIAASSIKGRNLEQENSIQIFLNDKGEIATKNKTAKVKSIMPDEEWIQKKISDFVNERYSEKFIKLLDAIGDKKLLAEILDIEETEDLQKLYKAYVDAYGNFFESEEVAKKRGEKMARRAEEVFRKHGLIE